MVHDYGFSLQVYPTHRTHSAPQQVYDCIAANAASATLNPAGGRWVSPTLLAAFHFQFPMRTILSQPVRKLSGIAIRHGAAMHFRQSMKAGPSATGSRSWRLQQITFSVFLIIKRNPWPGIMAY
jgi:hypothetical protein